MLGFSFVWLVLTAVIFPAAKPAMETGPAVGLHAPAFKLMDRDNKEIFFQGQAGKPVIINMWASWCPPCRSEMPALEKVYQQYKSAGLIVYGVNAANQDNPRDVENFLTSNGITFPILLDKDGSVAKLYAMRALPTTFFIAPDGTIHQVMIGGPFTESFLRSQVEDLLALEK
jgi:cytochrome c biogenesis protein CcmG/thiol:disulfide interchange protein DsbE